jgi:hypothetical protein
MKFMSPEGIDLIHFSIQLSKIDRYEADGKIEHIVDLNMEQFVLY